MDHIIIPDDEALIVDDFIDDESTTIAAEVAKAAAMEDEGLLADWSPSWQLTPAELHWQMNMLYISAIILMILVCITLLLWCVFYKKIAAMCEVDKIPTPQPFSPLRHGISPPNKTRFKFDRLRRSTSGVVDVPFDILCSDDASSSISIDSKSEEKMGKSSILNLLKLPKKKNE